MRTADEIRKDNSEKPNTKYYEKNKDRIKEASKQWRIENRERSNQISKESYKKHEEQRKFAQKAYVERTREQRLDYANRNLRLEKNQRRRRDYNLRVAFNITLEDYEVMFNIQQGKCYLCHKHQSELKMRLAVDHDHETGKVRKLLCNHCNLGIGQLKHDPKLLKRAVVYLEEAK